MIGWNYPDKLYFIGTEDGAYIKIGVAKDPAKRLDALRGGSPLQLTLLAIAKGGYKEEKFVHYRFWAHHIHCEWFRAHPEILAAIEHVKSFGTLPDHLLPTDDALPVFKWGPGSRKNRHEAVQ